MKFWKDFGEPVNIIEYDKAQRDIEEIHTFSAFYDEVLTDTPISFDYQRGIICGMKIILNRLEKILEDTKKKSETREILEKIDKFLVF